MADPGPQEVSETETDRFRIRYVLIFSGSLVVIEAYSRIAELYMMNGWAVLLGLLHVVALGVYFLSVVAMKLVMGYWKQFISILISPLLAFGIFDFQVRNGLDEDYISFLLLRPWYLIEAERLGEGETTFYAWYWGGVRGGVISSTYAVLIYDKTDQITRSPESRTPEWLNRAMLFASGSDLELRDIADPTAYLIRPRRIFIDKIADHFYVVTKPY